MSADDTKAAPSLALTTIQGVPVYWVEDARSLDYDEPCISITVTSMYFSRVPDADATTARQELKDNIRAALRAVEAVRALAKHWETWQPSGAYSHPREAATYVASARQSAKALRAAFDGGVEAVQALLEGER